MRATTREAAVSIHCLAAWGPRLGHTCITWAAHSQARGLCTTCLRDSETGMVGGPCLPKHTKNSCGVCDTETPFLCDREKPLRCVTAWGTLLATWGPWVCWEQSPPHRTGPPPVQKPVAVDGKGAVTPERTQPPNCPLRGTERGNGDLSGGGLGGQRHTRTAWGARVLGVKSCALC